MRSLLLMGLLAIVNLFWEHILCILKIFRNQVPMPLTNFHPTMTPHLPLYGRSPSPRI